MRNTRWERGMIWMPRYSSMIEGEDLQAMSAGRSMESVEEGTYSSYTVLDYIWPDGFSDGKRIPICSDVILQLPGSRQKQV